MSAVPKFKQSHLEPRTVPLSEKIANKIADTAPNPEEALVGETNIVNLFRPHLKFSALIPADHLTLEFWISGLSQEEIARYFGSSQQRIDFRLKRAMRRLKSAGIGKRQETI